MTPDRLALYGGEPVRRDLLPYARQALTEDDIAAVVEVLRSEWLTTGPKVAEFEEAFASYVGAAHAVSFSSGTAALHGAVFAAGLEAGDEAVTTPLTFCATANCLLFQGATPVFADVEAATLNLDPDEVRRRLSSHTKAILPVDYAGHPADLDEVLALSERHGLVVIEDAAHALGARYRNRSIGSVSHMTVFSFHPVKHLTTGEGGMVTTDDDTFAHRMRMFRSHGIDIDFRQRESQNSWRYDMVALGHNFRLTDIGAALGHSQLHRLDANLARRSEIATRYTEAFLELPGVTCPRVKADVQPAWHLYPLRLDLARASCGREEIFRALKVEGVGVNVHYLPIHLHSYYRSRFGNRRGEYPIAEQAYEALISLPMFPAMADDDVQDVLDAVRKVTRFFMAEMPAVL